MPAFLAALTLVVALNDPARSPETHRSTQLAQMARDVTDAIRRQRAQAKARERRNTEKDKR